MLFLFPQCVHSGYNYWPYSADCEECRGLPEELSHTLQALRLGYAGGAGQHAQHRAALRAVGLPDRCPAV